MRADDVAKILQVYMLQGLNSGSDNNDTSMMFELVLQSLLNDQSEVNINNQNSSAQQNDIGATLDNLNTSKSMDISQAIKYASNKYGIEEELIKAVIAQESSFNPNAVSDAGAEGLMQLMPATAKSLGVDNPFDVLENIDGGTKYLGTLLSNFNGNKELALAAYNGGIGRMKSLGVDSPGEISKMPEETQDYVNKVIRNYQRYMG